MATSVVGGKIPETQEDQLDAPEYPGFCPQISLGGTAGCSVWEGEIAGHGTFVLKTHSPGRGWQQEWNALRSVEKLDLPVRISCPRIVPGCDQPPTLLMSKLPGLNMAHHSFPMEAWSQATRLAARFLQSYQQQAFIDDDSVPLSQALPLRLERWIQQGKEILHEREIAIAKDRVGDGSLFKNQSRVPCHNDFQPRNWLWDGQQLSVIDFEHSHPNHPAFDWVRLETGLWQKMPQLKDEFVDEWGCTPSWASPEVLDATIAIYAIGCIVWGNRHKDREFISEGRRILDE